MIYLFNCWPQIHPSVSSSGQFLKHPGPVRWTHSEGVPSIEAAWTDWLEFLELAGVKSFESFESVA